MHLLFGTAGEGCTQLLQYSAEPGQIILAVWGPACSESCAHDIRIAIPFEPSVISRFMFLTSTGCGRFRFFILLRYRNGLPLQLSCVTVPVWVIIFGSQCAAKFWFPPEG